MKIKISIPGKTTVETTLLKGTQFALVKGTELHINPDGYEGEVKIITLKDESIKATIPSFADLFSYNEWHNQRKSFSSPVGTIAVGPYDPTINGYKWGVFNPIFP